MCAHKAENPLTEVKHCHSGSLLTAEGAPTDASDFHKFLLFFHVFKSIHSLFAVNHSPLPLRPTKRRSLNLATCSFIVAWQFFSSALQFSSLPARIVTVVPSPTSTSATTLKELGSVLLARQCGGSLEHKKYGLLVRTARLNDIFVVVSYWLKRMIN